MIIWIEIDEILKVEATKIKENRSKRECLKILLNPQHIRKGFFEKVWNTKESNFD